VGAQTVILARNSPQAVFTSIDISAESLAEARRRVRAAGIRDLCRAAEDDGTFCYTFFTAIALR
jgi:predicted O-methyltransferase YrrM